MLLAVVTCDRPTPLSYGLMGDLGPLVGDLMTDLDRLFNSEMVDASSIVSSPQT